MLGITDLRKGTLIKLDGQPWKVVEYSQKQMGRGGSTVNTKLKNALDGRVISKNFKGAEKVHSICTVLTVKLFLWMMKILNSLS